MPSVFSQPSSAAVSVRQRPAIIQGGKGFGACVLVGLGRRCGLAMHRDRKEKVPPRLSGTAAATAVACVWLAVIAFPTAAAGGAYFELWRWAPGKSVVRLATGRLSHRVRWGVYASRLGPRPLWRKAPCITVVRLQSGNIGSVPTCGRPLPASGDPGVVDPLIGVSSQYRPGGPVIEETIAAASFSPIVDKVRFEVEPGPPVEEITHYLSVAKARKAHMERFRYAILILDRNVCINRIVGFDNAGSTVLNVSGEECPLVTPPPPRG